MPNISCFCVFDCARMDIVENDKNHVKMAKPNTRNGKEHKAEAGKATFKK